MRKILSVTLVVVMLAALVTVFPVSAANPAAPDLLITEVCPDTTGLSGNGSDTSDCFEFMEIYNAGTTDINLYEYCLTIGTVTVNGTTSTYDPAKEYADVLKAKIEDVDPIQQKGTGAYNTTGTVYSGNYENPNASFYPTNPETAILKPGKTAVVWFVIGDAVVEAAARGKALSFDDFKSYYRMDKYSTAAQNDILIVAVDANGSSSTPAAATTYTATEKIEGKYTNAGVDSMEKDANNISGRFNLWNSNTKVYGIISNKVLDAELNSTAPAGRDVTKITYDKCISYAYANYATKNKDFNLAYKSSDALGGTSTGSLADMSYNFVVSNKKSSSFKGTGKDVGAYQYMDWSTYQFVTPGLLTSAQVTNFTSPGNSNIDSCATPSTNLAYKRNAAKYSDKAPKIEYTAYLQNFYGMADSTDSDAILAALGWTKSVYLNNGGTVRFSIKDGKLICDNLDVAGSIESKDGILTMVPSDVMKMIALDDYTIEYQLTYLDANKSDRYAVIGFNFNEKCSYDTQMIRINGTANNQRRIGGGTYTTYDNSSKNNLYAANNDTNASYTSLLNKITFGAEKVFTTTATDLVTDADKAQYAPLLGRTLNVKVEVTQSSGPSLYVNDIQVSKAGSNAYWGAQSNYGEFALGLLVTQKVKCAIDNIIVKGYTDPYVADDANDKLEGPAKAGLVEPATGDATIYVAVAMAVSFISLATLVVVKRRKNEN